MSIILTDECFIVSTQHHIIQKQVFDIHFTSEQKAFELQNRISGLFYSRLEGVIGGVLDQVTGEHTLVRFDTLEVDVGTVPYDRLEDLLADQLKDALEKALAERLGAGYRPGPAHEDAGVTTVKTSRIELLAHFLSTGTLPWWASRQTITDPLRVLELL
ncbi:MAG TPA: contractile injection system tape measure protein, partial [Chitinophagaceae bacterium]|nr:contractile injection system tape measure protein [Chitinophagaceae bacterium]